MGAGVCAGAEGLMMQACVCVEGSEAQWIAQARAHARSSVGSVAGLGGLEGEGFRLQQRICWLDFSFSCIILDVVGRFQCKRFKFQIDCRFRGAICNNHNQNSVVL